MTYYFIKTHYIPTESTKAIRDDAVEHNYWSGKGETNCTANPEGTIWGDPTKNELWDCEYTREQFAYKRLCDAKRSLKSHLENNEWETKQGHWIVSSEIETVEGD